MNKPTNEISLNLNEDSIDAITQSYKKLKELNSIATNIIEDIILTWGSVHWSVKVLIFFILLAAVIIAGVFHLWIPFTVIVSILSSYTLISSFIDGLSGRVTIVETVFRALQDVCNQLGGQVDQVEEQKNKLVDIVGNIAETAEHLQLATTHCAEESKNLTQITRDLSNASNTLENNVEASEELRKMYEKRLAEFEQSRLREARNYDNQIEILKLANNFNTLKQQELQEQIDLLGTTIITMQQNIDETKVEDNHNVICFQDMLKTQEENNKNNSVRFDGLLNILRVTLEQLESLAERFSTVVDVKESQVLMDATNLNLGSCRKALADNGVFRKEPIEIVYEAHSQQCY